MAGLVDPHLVTLYEYVETTAGAAIVMDLLEGVALRKMLEDGGPLTPEASLTLMKGSLLGLAALHAQGVVHRDYKPENVMVDAAGNTKLVDYGIAAPVGEIAGVSGTPLYMAPEQWRGEPSNAATDVYAATATFVECLTGHPTFTGTHRRRAAAATPQPPAATGRGARSHTADRRRRAGEGSRRSGSETRTRCWHASTCWHPPHTGRIGSVTAAPTLPRGPCCSRCCSRTRSEWLTSSVRRRPI